MKVRQRTYDEGRMDGIREAIQAISCAFVVAMDDRRLCYNTIAAVTDKAGFLFEQIHRGELQLKDIADEAANILEPQKKE